MQFMKMTKPSSKDDISFIFIKSDSRTSLNWMEFSRRMRLISTQFVAEPPAITAATSTTAFLFLGQGYAAPVGLRELRGTCVSMSMRDRREAPWIEMT
jgi:hypothetical protein